MKKKLRSRAGETISEVLVALLIASISLVMLAGMITASAHAIERSRKMLETYYEAGWEPTIIHINMSFDGQNYAVKDSYSGFKTSLANKDVYSYHEVTTP